MPSLRKRVSSYFRQLSFHNESSHFKQLHFAENTFINKYLQGEIKVKEGPEILHGKATTDLPSFELSRSYQTGPNSITGCYTGPHGGLTTIKRLEKHLSIPDQDIDFIDTAEEQPVEAASCQKYATLNANYDCRKQQQALNNVVDNSTMVIRVAGQEYFVTNKCRRRHSKSHSLGSLKDFEIEKTRIYAKEQQPQQQQQELVAAAANECNANNNNNAEQKCDNRIKNRVRIEADEAAVGGGVISKSKSAGNPFGNKTGRIHRLKDRPRDFDGTRPPSTLLSEEPLHSEWTRKNEFVHGISDSLYDNNLSTKTRNGNPIADCFGIITRADSAILAVADGVNWGEKAAIAAKCAVHGCLHYLNKTIFLDTQPFDSLVAKSGRSDEVDENDDGRTSSETNSASSTPVHETRTHTTKDVFVALLRAFNCAHDLILENKGMLTTLTVAVVLPLRTADAKTGNAFVCCVCNVGDSLAYVYSPRSGVREVTRGSHDITANRDMRDALGALGPVDGINPELSNLTLSLTTLDKGDILIVASDGLTDNMDPTVCRFAVSYDAQKEATAPTTTVAPPAKPPRKHLAPKSVQLQQLAPKVMQSQQQQAPKATQPQQQQAPKVMQPQQQLAPKSTQPQQQLRQQKEESKVTASTATGSRRSRSATPPETDPLKAQFVRDNALGEASQNISSTSSSPLTTITTKSSPQQLPPPAANNTNKNLTSQSQAKRGHRRSSNTRRHQHQQQAPPNRHREMSQNGRPNSENSQQGMFLRAKTSLDFRRAVSVQPKIMRDKDGIPYITPLQRYEITLLLIEDILRRGITGKERQCVTAKKSCEDLMSFVVSLTNVKRHALEEPDLYYDSRNGVTVEVSQQEMKLRRKRALEKAKHLPGKLDHITIVACNVGGVPAC